MKNSIFIIILFSLVACQPTTDDLATKKATLKEKIAELKSLQSEIDLLSEEVDELSPEKKIDSVMVELTAVGTSDFNRMVSLQGSVVSDEIVNASSEMGGRIISMTAREGQYISRGALVATIDMETVKNQINEIKTSLDLANTVYERQKRLWDQQIGSEMQYLQAKSNKESLEKNLVTVESQLSKSRVYAPASGIVNKEYLKAGEVAGPGTPIIEILDTRNLKVTADVPEQYLGSIKKGDKIKLFFPALNKELDAKISLIGATIDPANRTFEIETKLDNRKGIYKPNLLAEIQFEDFSESDVVTIPLELIQEEVSGRKYVFIVKTDKENRDVAAKAYITLGPSYEGDVVVTDGLTSEDRLVTVGGRSLVEGDYLAPSK